MYSKQKVSDKSISIPSAEESLDQVRAAGYNPTLQYCSTAVGFKAEIMFISVIDPRIYPDLWSDPVRSAGSLTVYGVTKEHAALALLHTAKRYLKGF